jgi:hypothetical protein
MEFREVYCTSCKKVIGRYNLKFFTEDKIAELVQTSHVAHIRNGHEVNLRKLIKN